MRQLTQAAADWITQPVGVEPINILIISWTDGVWNYYVDTNYGELTAAGVSPELGIDGLILEMTNFESLPTLDGSGSSQSISVKLNDTNGSLLAIMNRADIHKRPVKVAQWFKGIALQDSFILFEGQVSSPITWSEGERTLSFDIVSILESREIGFSLEEGDFDYVPPKLIGKMWPYILGSAFKVPAIRIQDVPKGVTSNTFRDSARTTTSSNNQASNQRAINDALYNSDVAFAHVLGLNSRQIYVNGGISRTGVDTASIIWVAEYHVTQRIDKFGDSDVYGVVPYTVYGTETFFIEQINAYQRKGNEYLRQAQAAAEQSVSGGSLTPDSTIGLANGEQFPQNAPLTATINGRTYSGTVNGNTFHIAGVPNDSAIGIVPASRVAISDDAISTQYIQQIQGDQEFVVAGGSQIFIGNGSGFGVDYIAAMDQCTVAGVYAKRTFGNVTLMWPVPADYYSVNYQNYGPNLGTGNVYDTIWVTMIRMSTPLSSRTGPDGQSEGWDDDIFVDLISPYGANPVVHMKILIQRYTNVGWDTTSFDSVETIQNNYPVGCAITTRKDVLTVMKEMAFQMRCNISYNNSVFKLKYLSIDYPYVDTVLDDDIERASLEITCSSTEDLVTKLTAKWSTDYSGDTNQVAIYRSNINRYGTHAQEYDFWMYNIEANVHKSAVFWLIRKSNTFKKVKFNTFLSKLALESNDYIQIQVPESHDGTIIGMVEDCVYDSATSKVTLVVWLPVRMGERTVYPFAMPADLPASTQFPPRAAIHFGEAGTGSRAGGQIVTQGTSYYNSAPPRTGNLDRGGNFDIHGNTLPSDANFGPSDIGNQPQQYPRFLNPADINRNLGGLGQNNILVLQPQEVKSFNIKPVPAPISNVPNTQTFSYPGIVRDHIGGRQYNVDVYSNGMGHDPTNALATQITLDDDDIIDDGTGCIIISIPVTENGRTTFENYIQVPVWAGPEEE